MKLHSLALVAAAILIPTAGAFLLSEAGQARGRGDRVGMIAGRGDLTPEQLEAKKAQREARHAERLTKIQEDLGLTDQQVAQISAVKDSYKPQKEALWSQMKTLRESGATREEVRAALGDQRKALHEHMKADISALLTPEQAQKMEELKGQWGKGHGRGKYRGNHNSEQVDS